MTTMCSASVSSCMHKPISWHANFICAQVMLKQPSLEPTVLHSIQPMYGAAIKEKVKRLQMAYDDAFRTLLICQVGQVQVICSHHTSLCTSLLLSFLLVLYWYEGKMNYLICFFSYCTLFIFFTWSAILFNLLCSSKDLWVILTNWEQQNMPSGNCF